MKINVTKFESKREYPYLGYFMSDESLIVLFTSPKSGIRVTQGKHSAMVGQYLENWAEDEFVQCPKGTTATFKQE